MLLMGIGRGNDFFEYLAATNRERKRLRDQPFSKAVASYLREIK